MNRIYQGRVSRVDIFAGNDEHGNSRWNASVEDVLWKHHELFQDAVNYYIIALASLGVSPESSLTALRRLLEKIWLSADKRGQTRPGMSESLRRTWQLERPPTLTEAISKFIDPLRLDGVPLTTAEKAAEYLLFKLGGDSAIQQGGRSFLPRFCDPTYDGSYDLSVQRRGRAADEKRLQNELYRDLSATEIVELANSITLGSVVNLQPDTENDSGEEVVERLKTAASSFPNEVSSTLMQDWLTSLPPSFSLPKRRGGNINLKRVNACSLFLAFPNETTKRIFQSTYPPPKENTIAGRGTTDDESRFMVDDDDPVKLARGTRGVVFVGFTALPQWGGHDNELVWKEFDIAAFKEALKVYNQFQANLKRREEKLNALATKLLAMDGERAFSGYMGDTEQDKRIRARLEKIWKDSAGKPKLPKADSVEELSTVNFSDDPRIQRLRRIINDDLAEEYRLTDGRKTPYGLRRRTIKGWGDVKRSWQKIVKAGESYSDATRQKLQDVLNDLRAGEKREQIGSHRLFEALLSDEAAWNIWREPDDKLQEQINKKSWATDPVDAFREYCETREVLEEVFARPLNFTPADARFSRRLFMFTDVCSSFGNDRGEYKHDPKSQSVTVPVAIVDAQGGLSKQTCRISYSAPRLLRDGIRAEDDSYAQNWIQPMMRALFEDSPEKSNLQELGDAAVQLMPDYDAQGGKRVLLNFPLSLDEGKLQTLVGKQALWQRQFVTWKRGEQLPFMRWTNEFDGKEPHRWFDQGKSFHVLSADLGTRHVAAIATIQCSKQKDGLSRFIGNDGNADWYARYRSCAVLRLPGENAQVLRHPSTLEKGKDGKAFREELYGERGRSAELSECQETLDILKDLGQSDLLNGLEKLDEIRKRFSFPELNDKLLVALRRAQGWIATCVSWHWKLTKPETDKQREDALQQLRENERVPPWQTLATGNESDIAKLQGAIQAAIMSEREKVTRHLLQLTRRILPLRNRDWEWVVHPAKSDCHLLRQTLEGTGSKTTKLRGQRGLSIARIEQLSELRRRWQSLNQSMRRKLGEKPPTAADMRNDPIPDPCPDVLVKLDHIREQRVNQTAHLILAQALGVRLREPKMSIKSRKTTDTHGEYEKFREPVDFIVVEDLSRYLSDQGRAKSENSRLMQWCHRAITQKLKMLAEVFGIPVLETPAAYSSRFCSLTGAAGFRAVEVNCNDRHKFPWRKLLAEMEKATAEGKEPSDHAKYAKSLFDILEKIGKSTKPFRTLLAPQAGGPMFLTAKAVAHPTLSARNVLPIQADINAAINLALRAVAHPACADIHHRLRTERKKDIVTARESRRFGQEKITVLLRDGDSFPKERNTNLFYDQYGVAVFGRARLSSDRENGFPYASGPGIWKAANDRILQWRRCQEINNARLKHWDIPNNSEFEEAIPM